MLVLMPAAVLVFLVLGALAVDAAAVFLAQRHPANAASSAANDAAPARPSTSTGSTPTARCGSGRSTPSASPPPRQPPAQTPAACADRSTLNSARRWPSAPISDSSCPRKNFLLVARLWHGRSEPGNASRVATL